MLSRPCSTILSLAYVSHPMPSTAQRTQMHSPSQGRAVVKGMRTIVLAMKAGHMTFHAVSRPNTLTAEAAPHQLHAGIQQRLVRCGLRQHRPQNVLHAQAQQQSGLLPRIAFCNEHRGKQQEMQASLVGDSSAQQCITHQECTVNACYICLTIAPDHLWAIRRLPATFIGVPGSGSTWLAC